jgi:hypothetical protein
VTPALALRDLAQMSADVRAAIVLDHAGSLAATYPEDPELGERLRELAREVVTSTGEAGADSDPVAEVEVATPAGGVYIVRLGGWTLVAVAGRFTLPALMRYDLRRTLIELEGEEQ